MPEGQPGYLTDSEYEFVYKNTPRLCADLVLVGEDGLLLTLRSIEPFKDTWHLPGGRVMYKELVGNALQRIALKELGVDIVGAKLLDFCEMPNDGIYLHSVSLVMLAKIAEGQRIELDEQASDIRFFKVLPENTHPYHREIIEKHAEELGITISRLEYSEDNFDANGFSALTP